MNFPYPAGVRRHRADPTEHGSGAANEHAADAIGLERGRHLLARGIEVLPILGPPSKGFEQQLRRRLDQRGVDGKVDDRGWMLPGHGHLVEQTSRKRSMTVSRTRSCPTAAA